MPSKDSAEKLVRPRALAVLGGRTMNPLIVVMIVVFVCATFLMLLVAASLFAALVFRFAPMLQGTLFALTASDVGRMLRQMPTYPAWWHRHGIPPPKPIFGLLALNPVGKQPEYLFGFNPLHQPVFTTNRDQALRVNCADKFAIEKLLRMTEDEGLNVFLVLAEGQAGRNPLPGEAGRLSRVPRTLRPSVVTELGTLRPRVAVASDHLSRSVSAGAGR
jgi:hypothetical protein